MRYKTKRSLKFIIPICLVIIALATTIFVSFQNRITSQTYYNSLTKSNFTKQEQITTIIDGQNIVYEKTEIMVFDNNKVYHKIIEKTLSLDENEYFDEKIEEFYYTQEKMYFLESGVWTEKDFSLQNNLNFYSLKDSYFERLEFKKHITSLGVFKGAIKNSKLDTVLGYNNSFKDANLKITINEKRKIQNLEIEAITGNNRKVSIKNQFSYDAELVELPV